MATIPLSKGQHAIIDDDDLELINKYKWHAMESKKTFYAVSYYYDNKKLKCIMMHRLILGIHGIPYKEKQTDHINRNGLDNRKENLRVCSNSENGRNRVSGRKKSSIYRGVFYHKCTGRWCSHVVVDYRPMENKFFTREIDAALHYDYLVRKYHGDFGITNFSL